MFSFFLIPVFIALFYLSLNGLGYIISKWESKKDRKKYRRENKGDKDDDNENNSFATKKKTIDVVFVLEDKFDGETAPEGEKYALVRPVNVGISSENHYAVKSGVSEKEMIVTGGYRVLSKELNHGTLVSVKNDPQKDNGKSE